MRDIIIFKIRVECAVKGFAQTSNFISKLIRNEKLTLEETQGITSLLVHNSCDCRSVAEKAAYFPESFKLINKPEALQGIRNKYELAFCLWIQDKAVTDIVDLQYDFLIKRFFSEEKIVTVLAGDKDLYFKASHYFYDVNKQVNSYYNSVYEWDPNSERGNSLRRLQIQNVGALKDFMPFQFFSQNQNILFRKVGEVFTREEMKDILIKKKSLEKYSPSLQGTFQLLRRTKYWLKNIDVDKLLELFLSGDVLALVLFAFSADVWMKGKQQEISCVKRWYIKMQEFSSGCLQLVENAVHHATDHSGGISIRYHEADSEYVIDRYGELDKKVPCLEILVTDYSGINDAGNIAENFLAHLDAESAQFFGELQPIDFLSDSLHDMRGRQIEDAFQNYYTKSEHIGKHIGLRVFKRIIERHNGIFGCYSHSCHRIGAGENYNFIDYESPDSMVQCVPGTSFAILLPLVMSYTEEITRTSLSMDTPASGEKNISEFLKGYQCDKLLVHKSRFICNSQIEKENNIEILSKNMKVDRYGSDGKLKIYYVDTENLQAENAEYFVKAFMIAGFDTDIPDFVLYNCSTEFILVFQQMMAVYLAMRDLEQWYSGHEFVIALFAKEPVYSVYIIPGNITRTVWLNKKNAYAGDLKEAVSWVLPFVEGRIVAETEYRDVPPYDILYPLDDKMTLFEQHTLQALEEDIQSSAFGCKISNTHMRLGSTIHIDCFVEAELLFSNRFFASRFVFLIIKDLFDTPDFEIPDELTIYSYALYSELLVEQLVYLLKIMYPKKSIDYAILEREADHRDFTHIDRIRYSTAFSSKEERSQYFHNRKVICIVPINSTLKTHEKLLSLFGEDKEGFSSDNIIRNYALVLVGSHKKNSYWEINEENKTFDNVSLNIKPIPRYFIEVKVNYYEALGCKLCFPENPLDEVPLVEVNAASTIPNQSFGLLRPIDKRAKIKYDDIRREEKYLSVLKDSLIYGHTQRGENHYLYYFKTDEFFLQQKQGIEKWLKEISSKIAIKENEYHILFCPAHFSNAGFLECINRIVFHEAALIIRVDVDKEYRSNICTKYSNLTEFIQLLSREEIGQRIIKIHYVDDSIISGRTFFRAKSLISSIVRTFSGKDGLVDVRIFEKVFVLLDRNSEQSRLQYIGCPGDNRMHENSVENSFYAFRTLKISSIRNHGDSCILCKLEREAKILYRSSSTKFMADYWHICEDKFDRKWLRDKQEEISLGNDSIEKKTSQEKAFRRMFSSHICSIALADSLHGNYSEKAVSCLLELLNEDYENRKKESNQKEAFEYFLSYLKIVSRPFCVFDKTIREAVFDVLLLLAESIFQKDSLESIIDGTNKTSLKNNRRGLNRLVKIIADCDEEQKMDLFLLLMKQLTEMKSNFFIRNTTIRNMVDFAGNYDNRIDLVQKMYQQYLYQIKKLLGVSSDKSKSAWFSIELSKYGETLGIPDNILGRLIVENTRAYYDGLEKMERNILWDDSVKEFLCRERWYGPEFAYYELNKDRILSNSTDQEIREFLQRVLRRGLGEVPARESSILEKSENLKGIFEDRCKKVKERKDEVDSQKPFLKETCEIVSKELEKAQYRDFRSVLENLGDITKDCNGKIMCCINKLIPLLAGVQLFRLCNEVLGNKTKISIEELCFNITALIEKILKAKYVQIILECPLECDEWEDLLIDRYNNLVTTLGEENGENIILKNHYKKEYLVIADSGVPDIRQIGIEDASMKVRNRLKNVAKIRNTRQLDCL